MAGAFEDGPHPNAKGILREALEANPNCVDCGDKKPTWVSLIKVSDSVVVAGFCCYSCASQHRSLGSAICKVKSCSLNEWNKQEIDWVENTVSNETVNAILEGDDGVVKFKPRPMSDASTRKAYIHMKYARQDYFNRNALQMFLLKGGKVFASTRGGPSSAIFEGGPPSTASEDSAGVDGFDDDDDLFDDSKTTTSDLFGHCTKTFNRPSTAGGGPKIMQVMEEEEDDDDGGFADFGESTEPAPFDPFGASAFAPAQDDVFAGSGHKSGFGGSRHSGGGGSRHKAQSLDDAFGQFASPTTSQHMSSGASVTPSVTPSVSGGANPDITSAAIERLEAEKRKAVAAEDYVRAAELKQQIDLARLEEEKKQAVAAEDYIRAAELKQEIDKFISKLGGKPKQSPDHLKEAKATLNNFLQEVEQGGMPSPNRRSRRHGDDRSVKSFGEDSYTNSPKRKSDRPPRGSRRPTQQELEGSLRSRGSYDDEIGSPSGSMRSRVSVGSAPPFNNLDEKDSPGVPKSPLPNRRPPTSSRSNRSNSSRGGGGSSRQSSRRQGVDRQHSSSSRDDDDILLREDNGSGRRRSNRSSMERKQSSNSLRSDMERRDSRKSLRDEEDDYDHDGRGHHSGSRGSSRRSGVERHDSRTSLRDEDDDYDGRGHRSRDSGRRSSRSDDAAKTSDSRGRRDDKETARQRRRSKSANRRRRSRRGAEGSRGSAHDRDSDDEDDNIRNAQQLEAY